MLSGLTVQIGLALLVLRWSPAADALEWLGNQISTFMYYSSHGARFVFGDKYVMHPFAMEVRLHAVLVIIDLSIFILPKGHRSIAK